ncbi:MAG: hypothetical protein Kow0029_28330 [Candidatus Rifleibacteriota bacterium]
MKEIARIAFLLLLAIFYIIIPIDLIPDRLGGGRLGRIDDLILIFIVIYLYFFKPLVDEMLHPNAASASTNEQNHKAATEDDDPFSILGVDRNAGVDEIKAAYYEKIKQYHPDLVSKMGPEIQQVAAEKTRRLNEAYETLMKKQPD